MPDAWNAAHENLESCALFRVSAGWRLTNVPTASVVDSTTDQPVPMTPACTVPNVDEPAATELEVQQMADVVLI